MFTFNNVVSIFLLMLVSLQEAQVFIPASQQDEVAEEVIMAAFAKIRPPMERLRRSSKMMDKEETVVSYHNKPQTWLCTRASFIKTEEACFSL